MLEPFYGIMSKKIQEIHQTPNLGKISECPRCGTPNLLTEENTWEGKNFPKNALELYERQLTEIDRKKQELLTLRENAYKSTLITVRATNIGFTAETIIPALDTFRFDHKECRFTGGDPIDYVIFKGLSTGKVDFIHFVDVKTGNARLTKRQEEIKKTIEQKNVKFRTF